MTLAPPHTTAVASCWTSTGSTAKYCVHNSRAVETPNRTQSTVLPRRIAWTWAPMVTAASNMNSEYMRASCEYQTQNGAIAARIAATPPGASVVHDATDPAHHRDQGDTGEQ